MLYVLQKKGGRSDIHSLFKILFFADAVHLSKYGRTITGDEYIAMNYGPVPSCTYDIVKALRGDSFFSEFVGNIAQLFYIVNKNTIEMKIQPDLDYLSESDIECLNDSIVKCNGLSFDALTRLSHGFAWSNTAKDNVIAVEDILTELGDSQEYVDYISENLRITKEIV